MQYQNIIKYQVSSIKLYWAESGLYLSLLPITNHYWLIAILTRLVIFSCQISKVPSMKYQIPSMNYLESAQVTRTTSTKYQVPEYQSTRVPSTKYQSTRVPEYQSTWPPTIRMVRDSLNWIDQSGAVEVRHWDVTAQLKAHKAPPPGAFCCVFMP